MSQEIENELKKLQSLQLKNDLEIEDYKKSLINEIKNFKKEDIVKTKKVTLWKKIKMILGL